MPIHRICCFCHRPYTSSPSLRKKFCGAACYDKSKKGSGNPNWKGGRIMISGYVYLYSPTHPAATKLGYVAEHRLVMEASLGRYLNAQEAVHHINEDRCDNRIANLHLCDSNGQHTVAFHAARGLNGQFTKRTSPHHVVGH